MAEKTDTVEKREIELGPLSKEDLDDVAGGKTTYWVIKHNTGCGGTFECNIDSPKYCLLCGEEIYWG